MLDWDKINTVFLDMDGTLLDLHFDNYFWREYVPLHYARKNEVDLQAAKDELFPLFRQVEGTMNWYCIDYWSDVLSLDIAALKREIRHLIRIHPFVIEFLKKMQASHHRVVLLTNAHQKSLVLKMEITQLEPHFDRVICAHDLGLPKENRKFWDKLKQMEPFEKENTLLIDDSISVLESARDYGLGYLVAVSDPDSRSETRSISQFKAIRNFSEIMPA